MNSIETHSLSYSFGRKRCWIKSIFQCRRKASFGFLGPNGSGNTTTIRVLLGLAKAPRGSVFLFVGLRKVSSCKLQASSYFGDLFKRLNYFHAQLFSMYNTYRVGV